MTACKIIVLFTICSLALLLICSYREGRVATTRSCAYNTQHDCIFTGTVFNPGLIR
jgi:hypothetical protein